MKTLLVPTDFSHNATHALRYACMLNATLKGKVILFHSYAVPEVEQDVPYVTMQAPVYMKEDSIKSLEMLQQQIRAEYPGMDIETTTYEGYPEETITHTAKNKRADFIVMGTQGTSGLKQALIGNITASVMEETTCPVIAVPEQALLPYLNKIVFATDYALNDFANISKVIELANPFNAEIILLHVSSGELDKAYEFAAIETFKEAVKDENQYEKITFKLLEARNVLDSLNLYLDEIKADLLVMSMHQRTFFQRIFNQSKTKKMAFHTHIPLLAFHAEE